mmetsp:Transcript_27611/g.66368  ORF Transcript_27611/g.66368 Transcript_27611/m.66368 type:complete len:266 (-) Transcript_27611:27-824(-)
MLSSICRRYGGGGGGGGGGVRRYITSSFLPDKSRMRTMLVVVVEESSSSLLSPSISVPEVATSVTTATPWRLLSSCPLYPAWRGRQFSTASIIRDDDSTVEEEEEEIDESNRRTEGLVVLKKTTDGRGWGVFADRSFQHGDIVMESLVLESSDQPTSHTIQTDWNKHVEINLPGRFVNHRCSDANVGIRPNSCGAYNFIALRQIKQGEEVLWDYAASEYQVKESFTCNCGSPNCRGTMKGYKYHGNLVETCYGKEFIAPYLQQSK